MNRLAGKRAIITGGATGIGKACVERMCGEGASVAILDMHEPEGSRLAEDLVARGRDVTFWKADVSIEDSLRQAIDAAAAHLGGLDILVNNAGIGGTSKPTDEVTEEEWDLVQAVNVKGVFFTTKHAIPHMRRAGGGHVSGQTGWVHFGIGSAKQAQIRVRWPADGWSKPYEIDANGFAVLDKTLDAGKRWQPPR